MSNKISSTGRPCGQYTGDGGPEGGSSNSSAIAAEDFSLDDVINRVPKVDKIS